MIKTRNALFALSLWSAMAATAFAQGTAFTYQGQLSSGGSPANGTYDVQFTLFSVSSGGSLIGSPAVKMGLGITNGLFTTALDFGSVFNGTTNWLELAVRTNGASSFSPPLTPRQQLTPTPYAVYAESANATNLVGTVAAANLPANAALLGANQTFTANNNFNGTVTITKSASGVPSGSSIDGSTFLHVNNAATDGNTSSPDMAGIAFGNNSTQQAIVGGTFGNDFLDFYTGGLLTKPKMRIDFNGDVGIGTDSPQWPLHVVGAGGGTSGIIAAETTGGNGGPQLRLKVGGPNSQEWVFVANGTINGPVGDLQIVQQVGGSRMVIRTNGDVGIGTTTPANKLDVQGSADFTGNVGIGTTTPKHTLDVAGNIWLGLQQEGTTFSEIGDSLYLGSPRKYLANTLGSPVDGSTDWINLMAHPLSAGIMFGLSGPSDTDPHSAPNPLMVIQSNGNVGIGTTSPSTRLDIVGTGTSDDARLLVETTGGTLGPQLRLKRGGSSGEEWVFVNDGPANGPVNALQLVQSSGGSRMTFATNGNVGIGTTTPNSDSRLQVNGMVRMGSETGTTEAPNRSVLVRRVNTSSSATGQIIARNGALTLERDGTAGGVIVKIATNTGFAPVITATGVTSTGTIVGFYNAVLNGGTAQTIQVFTDAQKIGHYTISFGDPLDQSDLTEVSLTRAVDSLNNTTHWVGTMTSTVNQ